MTSISERITRFLIVARWPLLGLGLLLAAVCWVPARSLDFDRSIENMFAPADPLLAPYERLKRTFGGAEVVLAVYSDPDLLNEDGRGIARMDEISRQLSETPGVCGILSLSEVDRCLDAMVPAARLLGLDSRTKGGITDRDSPLARRFLKLFEGYTHGADGQTAAIACMLLPEDQTVVSRRQTIDQLREKMERLANGDITGEPVMLVDGFRYIEQDAARLGWTCSLLLSLTILVCFRSVRWVLITLGVVQLALLLTRGLLVSLGMRLSMVSSMLTAIITVVGIATVVHIIVRFRDGRSLGLSPHDALLRTGRLLAIPVFWACTTDAVGFASLLVARVGPVRDFGVMMATGSMMVLVAVVLIVPALVLVGHHPAPRNPRWGERVLGLQLGNTLRWVERRPGAVALLVAVVVAAAGAGVDRLTVETDFTKNFRASSPIVRAYRTVETNLGGAGIWDVMVPASKRLNWSFLLRIHKLEQRLRDEITVVGPDGQPRPALNVLSMADAISAGAPILHRTRSPWKRVSALSGAISSLSTYMPAMTESLHAKDPETSDAYYFRIMLRAYERQPAQEKQRLIDQVRRISREEFPEAEVTGFFVLLTNLISSMIRDQWITFGVALTGIGLTMLLAFRRLRYALIALVPNALPILMVTGLMGWCDLKINMGAAMIAAVSMGLSIDSSIHYISFFLRGRGKDRSVHDALAEVQQTVGLAMVFSTIALMVGFSALIVSDFVPIIYFGVLVSLTMFGGLLGNLVILPLLLRLVTRGRNQT